MPPTLPMRCHPQRSVGICILIECPCNTANAVWKEKDLPDTSVTDALQQLW